MKFMNKICLLALVLFSFTVYAENKKPASKSKSDFHNRLINNNNNSPFQAEYVPSKVIINVHPKFRSACSDAGIQESNLMNAASKLGGNFVKLFPGRKYDESMKTASGLKPVDISLLYSITFSKDIKVEDAIRFLMKTGSVSFAEPEFIMHAMYVPNDTLNTSYQYYLNNIKAYEAYDITKGDTSIVIGITDSGVNTDHPDLIGNIAYNYNDPINGVDDDNDGYIDNYKGWDLGTNNLNPADTMKHGTGVAGLAAASADNVTGITGVGFKTRFLPIKISSGNYFTKSYDGIVYAAEHGCKIINCSWGGTGGGNFGQLIVDYAVINYDAVVVASAGNNNTEVPFYPATYDKVLSVAGLTSSDIKTSGNGSSSYGYYVDISSPASSLYTTRFDGTYIGFNGTSAAAPVISGCAGIVRAQFPQYNALQVAEQLRVTADKIDTLVGNASFIEKLGKGRANLYRAVTENAISVRMSNLIFSDMNDQVFISGDTVSINATFTNYLNNTSNLSVKISSSSPYIKVIDTIVNIGAMNTLSTYMNSSNPFRVEVLPGMAVNQKVVFRFEFEDGTYNDYQYFETLINANYINIAINEISTSVNSTGGLGYSGVPPSPGLGFDYNGVNMLYFGGLMIGNSSSAVSDNVYGSNPSIADNDFVSVSTAKSVYPSVVSDFDVEGVFNDQGSPNKLDITVKHNAYAWSAVGERKYVILNYNIKNTGMSDLNDVFAGIYADWDIMNYSLNKCSVDVFNKLAYAYSSEQGSVYSGIKVLSSNNMIGYMINNDGSGGSINVYDGFTSAEKYKTLSENRYAAGESGNGKDISLTVSTGPYNITVGDSAIVTFALLAGNSVQDIENAALAAQIKYNNDIVTSLHAKSDDGIYQFYPNPASDKLNINSSTSFSNNVNIEIFDISGRKLLQLNDIGAKGISSISVPINHLSEGLYLLRLESGGKNLVEKFVVRR